MRDNDLYRASGQLACAWRGRDTPVTNGYRICARMVPAHAVDAAERVSHLPAVDNAWGAALGPADVQAARGQLHLVPQLR